MGDPATQLPIVDEFKKAGRVRYVGITTTFPNQYAQLIEVMRNEPLDFFGVDYAADNRDVEDVILPLAIDEKIAVLAYPPHRSHEPLPSRRRQRTAGLRQGIRRHHVGAVLPHVHAHAPRDHRRYAGHQSGEDRKFNRGGRSTGPGPLPRAHR